MQSAQGGGMMKALIAAFALALLAGTASADEVWTYQGNSVGDPVTLIYGNNPCGCALSGMIDVTTGAYSFTDGTHTLTDANSSGIIQAPTTPTVSGTVWYWLVKISSPALDWGIWTQSYGSPFEETDHSFALDSSNTDLGLMVQGNEGIWTDTVSTPEPGTIALLGLGLAALALKRRKKHKHVDTSVWEPLA